MAQVCPLSDRDMMTGHLHFVQDRVQTRMVLAKRLQIGGCDAISDNNGASDQHQKSDLPAMTISEVCDSYHIMSPIFPAPIFLSAIIIFLTDCIRQLTTECS